MNGRLVLTNGGSDSGLIPIDKRQTVGHISPVTSGQLNIGQETLPFATIEADSFKRRTEEVGLEIHTPVGMIVPYAASGAPRGWLACDGAAVSRTQFLDLFNTIGTTFGIGDGFSTFNLPDLRARTIIGQNFNGLPNSGINNSSRTTKTLADNGGAETHILSTAEMPQHDHTQRQGNTSGIGLGPAPGTFGTNITNTSITTTDTGGGQAHNNLQPYLTLNYIIRF
jgi:microcystin-dependent protein